MLIPPKNETTNKIPSDSAHLLRTEIDSTDFKKENLTTKIRRNKAKKAEYYKDPETTDEADQTIKRLEEISTLEPGKKAQLEAKKISEKYKKLREANAKKRKYKIPGDIVRIEKVETDQGEVNVSVSIEKPKKSGKETAKKIIKKYVKIRWEKTFKKIAEANERKKMNKNLDIVKDIKNAASKKSAKITAKKILQKYKIMKKTKKTNLVNEEDIETIDYNEPQEDLFQGESIVIATNNALKKDRENAKNSKKWAAISAKKISKKYKNLKKIKENVFSK